MRALIFLVIVAVVLVIAAVASGFLNISRIRGAPPEVTAAANGVTARGGRPPAFDVETGSVKVGMTQTTVNVPTIEVQKPGQNQSTNNSVD